MQKYENAHVCASLLLTPAVAGQSCWLKPGRGSKGLRNSGITHDQSGSKVTFTLESYDRHQIIYFNYLIKKILHLHFLTLKPTLRSDASSYKPIQHVPYIHM